MPRCGGRVRRPRCTPSPLWLDLANKSPTGFEWGYGGSGPSQIALALCADAFDDEMAALTIYQNFKFRILGNLPRDAPWTLTASEVRQHCRELEARSSVGRDNP